MDLETIRRELSHAVTRYDRLQAKRKSYNVYALGQYLARVDDICADIGRGAAPRAAILAALHGSLLTAALRGIGEAKPTTDELARDEGRWSYRPVTPTPEDANAAE